MTKPELCEAVKEKILTYYKPKNYSKEVLPEISQLIFDILKGIDKVFRE